MLLLLFSTNGTDKTDGPNPNKKQKMGDESKVKMEKQNKLMFKYRDYLKTISIKVCKEILDYNKQEIPESNNSAVCQFHFQSHYNKISPIQVII